MINDANDHLARLVPVANVVQHFGSHSRSTTTRRWQMFTDNLSWPILFVSWPRRLECFTRPSRVRRDVIIFPSKNSPRSSFASTLWVVIPLPSFEAAVVAVCPSLVGADSPADRDRPEQPLEPNAADRRVAAPTAYFKTNESLFVFLFTSTFNSLYLNCVRRIVSCLAWFSSTSWASKDDLWLASCRSLRSFSHSRLACSTVRLCVERQQIHNKPTEHTQCGGEKEKNRIRKKERGKTENTLASNYGNFVSQP